MNQIKFAWETVLQLCLQAVKKSDQPYASEQMVATCSAP